MCRWKSLVHLLTAKFVLTSKEISSNYLKDCGTSRIEGTFPSNWWYSLEPVKSMCPQIDVSQYCPYLIIIVLPAKLHSMGQIPLLQLKLRMRVVENVSQIRRTRWFEVTSIFDPPLTFPPPKRKKNIYVTKFRFDWFYKPSNIKGNFLWYTRKEFCSVV